MKAKNAKMEKIFRWAYYGNISAIIAILVWSGLVSFAGFGDVGGLLLGFYFGAVMGVVPFLLLLFGLSIWGIVRYKQRRIKFIISLVVTCSWLIWSLFAYQELVLP